MITQNLNIILILLDNNIQRFVIASMKIRLKYWKNSIFNRLTRLKNENQKNSFKRRIFRKRSFRVKKYIQTPPACIRQKKKKRREEENGKEERQMYFCRSIHYRICSIDGGNARRTKKRIVMKNYFHFLIRASYGVQLSNN